MSYGNIPAELRECPQWVVWRYRRRHGKWTKVPFQAVHPREEASATDAATWGTFQQALAASVTADGIGFVFSPDDPYAGADFDALTPETEQAIRELDSYTEKSVSGRGAHAIVKATLKDGKGRRKGDFEIYSQSRYFAMTGVPLDGRLRRIAARQAEVDAVMGRLLGEDKPDAPRLPPTPIDASDQWILERMFHAKNGRNVSALWMGYTDGYTSHSDADAALCCHLAFWTGRDPERMDRLFRQSYLYREKWERASYREPTIDGAIRLTKEVYTPASEGLSGLVAEVEGGTLDMSEAGEPIQLFFTAPDLRDYVSPTIDWVVEKLLAKGIFAIFGGKPKCGKTTFLFGAVHAIMHGRPFMGLKCRRARVLYVTEQNKTTIRPKLDEYGLLDCPDLHIMFPRQMLGFTWPEVIERAAGYCEQHQIDLVIVDTVNDLCHLENSFSDTEWLEALDPLQGLAQHGGLAVLASLHAKKEASALVDMFRGSNAIVGKADIVLGLWREGSGADTTRTLEGMSRLDNGFEDRTRIVREGREYLTAGTVKEMEMAAKLQAYVDVLPTDRDTAMTRQEIAAALGTSAGSVTKYLGKLADAGKVQSATQPGKAHTRVYWAGGCQ